MKELSVIGRQLRGVDECTVWTMSVIPGRPDDGFRHLVADDAACELTVDS
jgi:hypothetical protein